MWWSDISPSIFNGQRQTDYVMLLYVVESQRFPLDSRNHEMNSEGRNVEDKQTRNTSPDVFPPHIKKHSAPRERSSVMCSCLGVQEEGSFQALGFSGSWDHSLTLPPAS